MLALFPLISRIAGIVALSSVIGSSGAPSVVSARSSGTPQRGAIGRDVGSASCHYALGTNVDFGIIATTAGKPYYPSGCLSTEYAWARRHLDQVKRKALSLADQAAANPLSTGFSIACSVGIIVFGGILALSELLPVSSPVTGASVAFGGCVTLATIVYSLARRRKLEAGSGR